MPADLGAFTANIGQPAPSASTSLVYTCEDASTVTGRCRIIRAESRELTTSSGRRCSPMSEAEFKALTLFLHEEGLLNDYQQPDKRQPGHTGWERVMRHRTGVASRCCCLRKRDQSCSSHSQASSSCGSRPDAEERTG